MIIRRQKEFNFSSQDPAYTQWLMDKGADARRETLQAAENAGVAADRLEEDIVRSGKRAIRNIKDGHMPGYRTVGDKIADSTRHAGRKVADWGREVKHDYQDLSDNYAQEHGHSLERDLAIGAGVAAAGAGGYAAYKAWKKKQAKKKEAQAQAEAKFDKKEEKK